MSRICVIVPVYNDEKFLCRCINSILNQTYNDFELILVDDGSLDKSGEICDFFAKKDKRIVVIHKTNGGPSSARNTGIEWVFANSCSKWLTFADSDDWLHPDYLQYMIKSVEDNNASLAFCNIIRAEQYFPCENVRYSFTCELSKTVLLSFSQKLTYVGPWCKIYNKELFKNIRFPLGKLWEDLATTYKLFLSVEKCIHVNCDLYFYYLNNNGTILKNWRPKRMDEFEAYENMLAYFKSKEEYHDLYIAYQEPYIRAISYSYYMCIKSDMSESDIKHYSKLISKKMRKALHMYKKNTNICFKNDKGVYETAYPQLMNYYWFINNKKKQLKGKK